MIKRPKPGEGEEELLRMQEEYLQEKRKDPNYRPAAQVTSLHKDPKIETENTNTGHKKLSKYAQSKGLKGRAEKRSNAEASTSSVMGDILEKNLVNSPKEDTPVDEDDKVYFPSVIPSVLGSIVEKNVDTEDDFEFPLMPVQGFPEVTKRDPSKQGTDLNKLEKMEVDNSNSHEAAASSNPPNLPNQSYMVTSQEATAIHNENIKLLSAMSEQQILEERQKLLGNLDPKLVDFIKAKRQRQELQNDPNINSIKRRRSDEIMDTSAPSEQPQSSQKPEENVEKTESSEEPLTLKEAETLWENDVLSHACLNTWLHFDTLEKDKLEWMKGLEESKQINPDKPYEARFNFKGYLLPYSMEYTEETKTLYHHHQEPNRPGYTLDELIQFARSQMPQQRAIAMNTFAGMLEYHSAGIYKGVIDLPLSKIFFIIRITLDDNRIMILEPALRAMRNLFYNRIDEAALDSLIGFEDDPVQPCLQHDKAEVAELDTKECNINDFHLAEIDLISAALRTDILQKMYYILDTVKPNLNSVQYALQIIIRLARDSVETSMMIVQTEHLMKAIVKHFLPISAVNFPLEANMIYKKPIVVAVRLMRVLCLQDKAIASILVDKYEIVKPICEYLSSSVERTYGLKLQIESYYLLTNLLCHRLGVSETVALMPALLVALHKHVHGTNLFSRSLTKITHAAALLQLLNRLLTPFLPVGIDPHQTQLYQLIKDGMQKWIKQCFQAETYTNGHLRLLWAALNSSSTLKALGEYPVQIFINFLKHLSSSQGFCLLLRNQIFTSNLLSGLDNNDLHSVKNLRNLGATVIDSPQKILPILNPTTPYPFLSSLFRMLTDMYDKILSEAFLQHMTPYLKKFVKKAPALTDNWFTRTEVDFTFYVVRMALQINVNECDKDLLYVAANKLCYIFRSEKYFELEFLFNKIVFNPDWFAAERLLQAMNISQTDRSSEPLQLVEIKKCYCKAIKLCTKDIDSSVTLLEWKEPILPRDWIYLPILLMYSQRHDFESAPKSAIDLKKQAEERESVIVSSLEWILFNEICFPDLLNDISVTDRFCRIMCVFLCDNTLFLDAKVKVLLQRCIRTLYRKKKDLNFDKELIGLHNFQDFYTEFLEQFQSVSYGDPMFAACVLVPLAQRHNVKWRKLIWSEYAGCLRALDCPEDFLCYDLNDYLNPEETDESLIKSYYRALSSNLLRQDTVAHKIAKHHVDCYKLRSKNVTQ